MFLKGQFIRIKGGDIVYKVVGKTKIGCDRCYILRPKGARSDKYDFEENISYVNREYELVQRRKKLAPLPDFHKFLEMIKRL
jgi:hypothetical protein